MQGKGNDVLRQVQELFCLRELVTSSYPRSDPETAKKPFFLKGDFCHFEESANLIIVDMNFRLVYTG